MAIAAIIPNKLVLSIQTLTISRKCYKLLIFRNILYSVLWFTFARCEPAISTLIWNTEKWLMFLTGVFRVTKTKNKN